MSQLEKRQSEVRVSTILVMDELFRRSHCFRCLLLTHESFDVFLSLIGLSCHSPSPSSSSNARSGKDADDLPPPAAARRILRKTAILLLDKWNKSFASGYPILSSVCSFLSSERGVCFSDPSVRTPHEAATRAAAEERRKQRLEQRMQTACQQFEELSQEIESTLQQADEVIGLLVPDFSSSRRQDEEDQRQPESHPQSPHHLYDNVHEVSDRLSSPPPQACDGLQARDSDLQENAVRKDVQVSVSISATGSAIRTTTDNEILVSSIRDHYKLLIRSHLPKLKNLLKTLSQGVEYSEQTLKRGIDLKNEALVLISKMSEMGVLNDDEDEDKGLDSRKKGSGSKEAASDDDDGDDEFIEVPEKEGLQLVIPQHERHLYGLQDEATSSRSSHTPSGKSCRAPLASGRLCPRRDLLKCPFHGPIVDRDETGIPVHEEDRQREERERAKKPPEWQDPSFLRDLEAATGIDLTVTGRRQKKRKSLIQSEAEVARHRNPKERLMQRIFAKESRLRVARDMDEDDAANQRQYEDNWAYAMNS